MKKIIIIAELILSVGIFLACSHDDDVESKENGTTSSITPNSSIANPIDLGLSVLWADRNFGATMPELQGQGRAWGDINSYSGLGERYRTEHYVFNGTEASKAPSDISGTQYDAARATWGGKWRMPTKSEVEELIKKCKFVSSNTSYGSGVTVKGPNGKTIFLPCTYTTMSGGKAFESNRYWTSALYKNTGGLSAYTFGFPLISTNHIIGQEVKMDITYYAGNNSFQIRPVMDK